MDILLPGDASTTKVKRLVRLLLSTEFVFACFVFPLVSGLPSFGFPVSLVKIAFVLSAVLGLRKLFFKQGLAGGFPLSVCLAFVAFAGWIVFSGWPLASGYPWNKASVLLTYTSGAFLGAIIFLNSRDSIERFMSSSLWITLVLGGIALIGFSTGTEILQDPDAVPNIRRARTTVGGGSPITLGRAAGSSILICVWSFLNAPSRRSSMWSLLAALSFFGFLGIASGTRAPAIACVVGVAFLIGRALRISSLAMRGAKLIAVLVATLVLMIGVAMTTDKFDQTLDRLGEVVEKGTQTTTFNYRRQAWQIASNMFDRSPLTGHGLGSFKRYSGASTPTERVYPHNIIWELLCESGLIGTTLFLALNAPAIRLFWAFRHDRSFPRGLSGLVFVLWVFFLLNAFSSGDINDNRVLFCLFGLSGNAAVWSTSLETNEDSRRLANV